MQSLHSHLRKDDLLEFEATPKIAKINKRGVKIRSGGSSNLPKLMNVPPFIVGFRVMPSTNNMIRKFYKERINDTFYS